LLHWHQTQADGVFEQGSIQLKKAGTGETVVVVVAVVRNDDLLSVRALGHIHFSRCRKTTCDAG
jgi:hypothetical protein